MNAMIGNPRVETVSKVISDLFRMNANDIRIGAIYIVFLKLTRMNVLNIIKKTNPTII
jgi:hypothetical protein